MLKRKAASISLPETNTRPRFKARCNLQTLTSTTVSQNRDTMTHPGEQDPGVISIVGWMRGTHHRAHPHTAPRLTHRGYMGQGTAEHRCSGGCRSPCRRQQQHTENTPCTQRSWVFACISQGSSEKPKNPEGSHERGDVRANLIWESCGVCLCNNLMLR